MPRRGEQRSDRLEACPDARPRAGIGAPAARDDSSAIAIGAIPSAAGGEDGP
jgi:hypothetical protein